ncbi:MAG TPA: carboxyvinyl-carboxyphosphonate phosphorylmutase [Ktedonobacter sp.]|jgi:2,3-dimethylmalate lyase|nr:carboxyvinyl-carboxyphosphonate phosphorylmutase [Ktedonobacter sp.]HAT46699.1 carboxyvinyl-carboxyphosphonate phosphorylmutase [Ktedonobacter sp.]HCP75456.1 carboxyvinyl-carboxyphosphonate phosphorylmutase [Ktedonobacter sp.]
MRTTTRLRELLAGSDLLVAPGAYDALSARLIAQAGFSAVYMTGFGTAASVLGQPDVGLLTMSEMVSRAAALAAVIGDLPLISDADTGYGNPISVRRTVSEFERAGVAGVHLEDQVWPKKCGHMEGKQVIPMDEMVQKIRAAVDARQDADFVIIARTDANAVYGLEDALRRGQAYREAGADALFIEAPRSLEELRAIAAAFPDVPLLFNWAESGKTPLLSLDEIRTLGFKLVIFPVSMLFAATHAMLGLLEILKQGETPAQFRSQLVTFSRFTDAVGLPEIQEFERRYGVNQS